MRGRRFYVTADGARLAADRAGRAARRGGLLDQVGHLLGNLTALPVTEVQWSLEPGELGQAVAAWNDRADQLIAGSKRRRPERA